MQEQEFDQIASDIPTGNIQSTSQVRHRVALVDWDSVGEMCEGADSGNLPYFDVFSIDFQ
jgi:hypothetical protein